MVDGEDDVEAGEINAVLELEAGAGMALTTDALNKKVVMAATGGVFTTGADAPSGGSDGDWYLRSSNLNLYFKSSGSWASTGQLVPVV